MSEDSNHAALARVEKALSTMDERFSKSMDDVNKSLGEVRERLARVEASSTHTQLAEMRNENSRIWEQLGKLEAEKNIRRGQMEGAKTLGEWTYRLGPWFAMIALAVWLVLKTPR